MLGEDALVPAAQPRAVRVADVGGLLLAQDGADEVHVVHGLLGGDVRGELVLEARVDLGLRVLPHVVLGVRRVGALQGGGLAHAAGVEADEVVLLGELRGALGHGGPPGQAGAARAAGVDQRDALALRVALRGLGLGHAQGDGVAVHGVLPVPRHCDVGARGAGDRAEPGVEALAAEVAGLPVQRLAHEVRRERGGVVDLVAARGGEVVGAGLALRCGPVAVAGARRGERGGGGRDGERDGRDGGGERGAAASWNGSGHVRSSSRSVRRGPGRSPDDASDAPHSLCGCHPNHGRTLEVHSASGPVPGAAPAAASSTASSRTRSAWPRAANSRWRRAYSARPAGSSIRTAA